MSVNGVNTGLSIKVRDCICNILPIEKTFKPLDLDIDVEIRCLHSLENNQTYCNPSWIKQQVFYVLSVYREILIDQWEAERSSHYKTLAQGNTVQTLSQKERRITHLSLLQGRLMLSVMIVDDFDMQEINREHNKTDRSTDVLSFPIWFGKNNAKKKWTTGMAFPDRLIAGQGKDQSPIHLGDIVISLDTCQRNARSQEEIIIEQEFSRLLIHGLLHLIGYDHELNAGEMREMREWEKILNTSESME